MAPRITPVCLYSFFIRDLASVAAADPLNLAGIVVPGERIPAVPGREIRYRNGVVFVEGELNPEASALPDRMQQPIASARKLRFLRPILPIRTAETAPPAPTLF